MDALAGGRYTVQSHEPLGHEPLERLVEYNEAFEINVSNGSMPQMAVAVDGAPAPQSPLPRRHESRPDDDVREQNKYIYPMTAENMGDVLNFTNEFVVPRTPLIRTRGSSPSSGSLSSESEGSSGGNSALDPLPPARRASLSPERLSPQRRIPLARSCVSPGKRRQQSSLRLESKAMPSPIEEIAIESKTVPQTRSDAKELPISIVAAEVAEQNLPTSSVPRSV